MYENIRLINSIIGVPRNSKYIKYVKPMINHQHIFCCFFSVNFSWRKGFNQSINKSWTCNCFLVCINFNCSSILSVHIWWQMSNGKYQSTKVRKRHSWALLNYVSKILKLKLTFDKLNYAFVSSLQL